VKFLLTIIVAALSIISIVSVASELKSTDIRKIISKEEFSTYKNVGDFIDHSPKVTVVVKPEPEDIAQYGNDVVKSLTGSDCDRDGKMDDNAKCNAVYYKLWMEYER
jgi:hypothetical protein